MKKKGMREAQITLSGIGPSAENCVLCLSQVLPYPLHIVYSSTVAKGLN